MAVTTHIPAASLGIRLSAPFRAIGRFLVYLMENNSRLQRVQRLQAMNDEQLAKLGIAREDIVHHVFKDLYGM
ncbi:hypothetical protein [Actibacterium sp. MT2.3-13A]|uniref:hypothetical protein n=1 Tax=Actibacterium sp. MT2.3-13A TaxID=2828332 RepID=UPI001BA77FC9|nr:hypothetical protein [Actibacterium sp. MT2.3-13A]